MNKITQINQNITTDAQKTSPNKNVAKTENTKKNLLYENILPHLLHNLEDPSQYLTDARKKANTSVQSFSKLLEHHYNLEQKNQFYQAIIDDPNFLLKAEEDFSIDEFKNYTNEIFMKVIKTTKFSYEDFKDFKKLISVFEFAGTINSSVGTKIAVHYGLFCKSIQNLGTEKHIPLLKKAVELKELGCFLMTEIAHGSNVQSLLTTAHYNHQDRSFTLNTPHEMGMKFWIGNLAKTANYGVCFANLVIGQKNYGIHIFLVKIRDSKGEIIPGINLGDCGPKLGIQGVDNGWALFRRVKIPYDNLLDKYSQIDEQGNFVSLIKGKDQRFALQLSALSSGRILVASSSSKVGLISTAIAARYLTIRKQFGTEKFQEQALIDYPVIQDQLFTNFSKSFVYTGFVQDLLDQVQKTDMTDLKNSKVKELHALCSWIKGVASDHVVLNLLNMRELCGGHGYSVYSQYPRFIKDMIVQSTWEGSNGVLIQQTAKFLLTQFSKYIQKGIIKLDSLQFLKQFEDEEYLLKVGKEAVAFFEEENTDMWVNDFNMFLNHVKVLFQIRVKNVGELVAENFALNFEKLQNLFQAFNSTLPQGLIQACHFYGQYELLLSIQRFFSNYENNPQEQEKIFLKKTVIVYMLKQILENNVFYQGLIDLELLKSIQRVVFKFYPEMKNDLLIFGDTILPPDEVLKSTVGVSTGNVYQQIMNRVRADPRNLHTEMIWNRN